MNMLRECRRILKPGGVLRLALPDLMQVTKAYINPEDPAARLYLNERDMSPISALNKLFYSFGHQWMYDEGSLRQQLHTAGFTNVECVTMGKSAHEALRDVEAHDPDRLAREYETIVLEAN